MKKINYLITSFLVLGIISCKDNVKQEYVYTANVPVYMSHGELKSSVKVEEPREIEQSGKIYIKDHLLFVNEPMEGIHIFDNSDPSAPRSIAFVEIPGNVDLAVKGSYMYVDNYTDLVVLDISNVEAVREVHRVEGIFPNEINFDGFDNSYPMGEVDMQKGVVVDWEVEQITVEQSNEPVYTNNSWNRFDKSLEYVSMDVAISNPLISPSVTGTGGSMARFTICNDYLYTVNEWSLQSFDISNLAEPVRSDSVTIGFDIETIFPYNDKLFIGSQSGMFIYSLSTPSHPEFLTEFTHMRSCDPVVAEGNYAYVTLRGGSMCGGFENQLDVIDISDVLNPVLIKSYPLNSPYGLGIDNGKLFICDGNEGLKVYDASDPTSIGDHMIAHFDSINTFDVIPRNNLAIMIGTDGLFQYDYSDLTDLKLLSTIDIYNE